MNTTVAQYENEIADIAAYAKKVGFNPETGDFDAMLRGWLEFGRKRHNAIVDNKVYPFIPFLTTQNTPMSNKSAAETAKELYPITPDSVGTVAADIATYEQAAYTQGATDERELMMEFAEWCSIVGWKFYENREVWVHFSSTHKTTAQLLTTFLNEKRK